MNGNEFFIGKRVTVMGLGLLGRGVGDAAYIAASGAAEVIVTDLKSETELAVSVAALSGLSNVRFVLGEHRLEDFENRDLILVAAGVPMDSPYLAHARKAGVRLAQSAALFQELAGIPMIGITGTRGKSTVTHMIHHVLSVVTGEQIILGGNIRGVSNLQLLSDVRDDSIAVMELDSWQLQGFGWAGISPQVAVFTNFMPDHQNYYLRASERSAGAGSSTSERALEGSSAFETAMGRYFADKANIFMNQKDTDMLITTPEVFTLAEAYAQKAGKPLTQEVALVDASILPDDILLSMPGEHNRLNAALAYRTLASLNLLDEEIFEALSSFPGVEGRLQFIGEVNGVRVYNDNNSTTPQATIAGLEALAADGQRNIVLIAGGAYKDIDPTPLLDVVDRTTKYVALLAGSGTDRIADELSADVFETLPAAVEAALERAEVGDTLLFSPGFASFGMFKNEYDRNDQFVSIINSYEAQ